MKVYLDDVRDAPQGWVRTKTAQETIDILRAGQVSEISLDHDLGYEVEMLGNASGLVAGSELPGAEGTGMDVLNWLESALHFKVLPKSPIIHIHTANASKLPVMQKLAKVLMEKFT